MANSTAEYWDIDGTSLNTYARNIQSWGEDRISPPPQRGDNPTIAYRPARRFVPQIPDERVITLGMWVLPFDSDGNPLSGDPRGAFNQNWRDLMDLLYRPWTEFDLTKRWIADTAGTVKSATARATYAGGLEPEMMGRFAARFTVDLLLTDPYFYDTEQSAAISAGGSLTHPGQDRLVKMEVDLGAGERLTNDSAGVWVENNGGAATTVDTWAFTSSGTSVGNIANSGDFFWMVLLPGTNNFSGNGTIRWQPNYL